MSAFPGIRALLRGAFQRHFRQGENYKTIMIFIFNKEVDNLYFILQHVILIMLYILIDVLKGMLGKNVLSLLYISSKCVATLRGAFLCASS